jgi:hypothetical protein
MDKKWTDATKCADRLAALDAGAAKDLKASYKMELENELTKDKLNDAIRAKNFKLAKKELAAIEPDSVYRQDAEDVFKKFQDDQTQLYGDSALAAKRSNKCNEIDKLLAKARDEGNDDAVARIAENKCTPGGNSGGNVAEKADCSAKLVDGTSACKKQFCASNPDDSRCAKPQTTVTPPPANCDYEAVREKGLQSVNLGQHAAALAQFEASLRCKDDNYTRELAFMESCASGNSPKAKLYYKRLNPAKQSRLAQMCIRQRPPVDYE